MKPAIDLALCQGQSDAAINDDSAEIGRAVRGCPEGAIRWVRPDLNEPQ